MGDLLSWDPFDFDTSTLQVEDDLIYDTSTLHAIDLDFNMWYFPNALTPI